MPAAFASAIDPASAGFPSGLFSLSEYGPVILVGRVHTHLLRLGAIYFNNKKRGDGSWMAMRRNT